MKEITDQEAQKDAKKAFIVFMVCVILGVIFLSLYGCAYPLQLD